MIKLVDILKEIEEEKKIDFSAFNLVDDEVEDELEKISSQQNEAILTTAALVLALPKIVNSFVKAGKVVARKSGINLAKPDPNAWYNILDKWTEQMDTYVGKPFDIMLKPFIKDNIKRKKAVDIIKAISLAVLATVGAVDISQVKTVMEFGSRLVGPAWDKIVKSSGNTNKIIEVAGILFKALA